jgi:DNA-binding response OmpR family regulator
MNRVLIIEDDENIAEAFGSYFELNDWEVVLAGDGLAGLEKAKTLKPDLIVLDINLPKLTGREVCHKLKEDASVKHIPVILMTGEYREYKDIAGGLLDGASEYLLKPVDPAMLFARAESIVAAARARLQKNG